MGMEDKFKDEFNPSNPVEESWGRIAEDPAVVVRDAAVGLAIESVAPVELVFLRRNY